MLKIGLNLFLFLTCSFFLVFLKSAPVSLWVVAHNSVPVPICEHNVYNGGHLTTGTLDRDECSV